MKLRSPSLRWRMAFWLFALMTAASIALSVYYHDRIGTLLEREADARVATLARHLSATSVLGVLAGSEELLAGTLRSAAAQDDVLGVSIFDANGTLIATSPKNGARPPAWSEVTDSCAPCAVGPGRLRWVQPVTRYSSAVSGDATDIFVDTSESESTRIAGWVVLEVSTIERQRQRRASVVQGIMIAVAVLCAGLVLTMVLSRKLTQPLHALTVATKEIGRGHWDVPLQVDDYPGEVLDLARAFSDMAAALADLDNENRRYREELEDRVQARTAELQAAYNEMKELNDEKDRFVSTVSHDFRSPLAIVLSSVQTVLSDDDMPAATRQRFLSRAERQCHRLGALVNDLLDLARIENRRMVPAPIALERLLADWVDAKVSRFNERHIGLCFHGPSTSVVARVDRALIERAVSNLLDNALKFTPEQGSVTVVLRIQGDDAHIEVTDTGDGVLPEELPRLFERFYQGTTGATRGDGSGLGLAIVHEVARKHGGRVEVESQMGCGATFTMTLPLALHEESSRDQDSRS